MGKIFLSVVDLISKKTFTEGAIQDKISKIKLKSENNDAVIFFLDQMERSKDGRLEIYIEEASVKNSSEEEIIISIKLIEKEINGFISGSYLEISDDSEKIERWERTEFSWEKESVDEEESGWEKEWDEYNDEWN
jgi:asparagine synthetase B (glutamine-hydrolysing)